MWNFSKKAITMIAVLSGLSLLCGCDGNSINKKQIETGDIYIGANKVYEEKIEIKNESKTETEAEIELERQPETEIQSPETVPLNSIKVSEHSKNFSDNNVNVTDILGNTYYNASTIGKSGLMKKEDYAIYYLGGKYKTLSGIIAIDEDNSEKAVGELSILCDNTEVYTTEQVKRITVPIEFSIDVEGCQWLNICHDKSKMKFILADWQLQE